MLVSSILNTQFAPKEVQNRKNIHLAKQPDEVLITCYLCRTRFLRTINNLFSLEGQELAERCAQKGHTTYCDISKKYVRSRKEVAFWHHSQTVLEHLHLHQMQRILTRIQLTVLLYNLLEVEAHKVKISTLKWTIGLKVLTN